MKNKTLSSLNVIYSIWTLLVLMMNVPSLEARVDEMEQAAPKYREAQQPPASTPAPEPPPLVSVQRLCFHVNRTACPTGPLKCERVNPTSVVCCDVDSFRLKEGLAAAMTQNTTNLHVLNATIPELDVSQAVFRRLASMAVTDGNIGDIVGQFPKYSSLACLNISNNNLKSATLQPSNARPFAYLFNLTILDASANNLTHFPLSLVHSNRNISIDLSGNDFLPCKEFLNVIDSNTSSLVTYLNYNKTMCLLNLEWNWWIKSRAHVHIDHIRVSKELNASCRNIKPEGIDCACALERRDVLGESISYQVSVDCAGRKLRHMPSNLPDHTVKLNVSWNNITSLEPISDDPSYDHLRQLVVDHNQIPNIIELEGTKFIDNFMLFSIKYNKLKVIPTYVLSNKFDRNAYSSFLIAGNYIHCDCNIEKVLKPWLKENAKSILDYKGLMCENNMGSVADLIEYKISVTVCCPTKVFNQCVLPVMTYGAETWSLTMGLIKRLSVTQRAMERAISLVCQSPRDWTDYISIIIGLEVLTLVLLISKVSYDYWIFKTAGYLPWPANKMPRLPCDWLCE